MHMKTEARAKIVETASRLFQLKGYPATGLNEILRESGAPKGSLYYYFPGGKEELALAAIDLAGTTMQEKVSAGLRTDPNAARAVSRVIEDMIAALKENGRLQNMSLSLLALETCETQCVLRDACAHFFEKMASLYAGKLSEDGYSEQRADELGVVLQAMIEGAITLSVTSRNTAALEAVLRQIPSLLGRKA